MSTTLTASFACGMLIVALTAFHALSNTLTDSIMGAQTEMMAGK